MRLRMKKSLCVFILCVFVALALTGCGGPEEVADNSAELLEAAKQLQEMYNQSEAEKIKLGEELEALKKKQESIAEMLRYYDEDNEELVEYGTSVVLADGSKARLSLNGLVSLGTSIQMTHVMDTDDRSNINMSKSVSLSPSNNWVSKFIKNGIQLEHVDGISGEINVRNGLFTDSSSTMYSNYTEKLLNEIDANVIEKRALFLGESNVGYTVRASVNVIGGSVILDWEEFEDKDNKADEKVAEAGRAEEELEALKEELRAMKEANEKYEAAVLENEELSKENAEIEKENKEALEDDANAELIELNTLIDLKSLSRYSAEEISAKEAVIVEKSESASDLRAEADDIRKSTPSKEYAEPYFLEVGMLNNKDTACYYYILYKKVKYQSVSETVDALIKSISVNGTGISIN